MSNMKRILNDIKHAKTLENCGIFISVDEEKATEVHALIQGVEDTPYNGGFFYFTLVFPSEYPLHPPHVTLRTTGSGTVRFNPNLYSCGKVCLSILGTWSGPAWTPGLTLSSVLLSIQTLLCPQPMLNEPGYENHRNTSELQAYNAIIQHETLRVALVANVKAIYNGTSCIPVDLHQHIMSRFAAHLPYVTATCQEKSSLSGKRMSDPFGESRGVFCFAEILRQFVILVGQYESEKEEYVEDVVTSIEVDEVKGVIDLTVSEENCSFANEGTSQGTRNDKEGHKVSSEEDNNNNDDEEENENPVPEELKCGICFDILATPAVLECGHVFCYLCALRWLDRNPICPTCRHKQVEVTKLRRIFTLDMICDREAKSRNKSCLDVCEQQKRGSGHDGGDKMDEKVHESTYAMWCSRRDEGVALDNGKRLEAGKKSGHGHHNHHYGDEDDQDEDYHNDNEDDDNEDGHYYSGHGGHGGHGGYGGHGGHGVFGGFSKHGGSYFSSVGGVGNVLGGASDSNSTADSLSDKRELEKDARLKRFATEATAPSPHQFFPRSGATEASASSSSAKKSSAALIATGKASISPSSSIASRFLSPEEREMDIERVARAVELERLRVEKMRQAQERKRLQIEIEHDRAERKKNCGVLPGSHDSLFSSSARVETFTSADVHASGRATSRASMMKSTNSLSNSDDKFAALHKICADEDSSGPDADRWTATTRKVDSLLDTICKPFETVASSTYASNVACSVVSVTSAAEVDVALGLLLKILENIIDHPDVEKYRSINTTGKMYKEKLARVLGVRFLFHALGFKQEASATTGGGVCLVLRSGGSASSTNLSDDHEMCVLIETRDKILSIVECRKIFLS